MRWVLAGLLLSAGTAYADDPRDTFGLKPVHKATAVDCSAGEQFGCVTASDPFADVSPYGLTTYLSSSYLRSLPVADATHDQIADFVLGASSDDAGPSFAGATGLENRWTIQGAPSDGLRTGGSDSSVPLVFLDGIRITTGGFTAHDRASTGATIDAHFLRGGTHHVVESYAWFGYTVDPPRRPQLPNNFDPAVATLTNGPALTAAVVASGPVGRISGGKAWYAAGIAPTFHLVTIDRTLHTLVDANHDNIPDGAPGILETDPVVTTSIHPISTVVPAFARAGLDRGHLHADLTGFGELSYGDRFFGNATTSSAGVTQARFSGDAIATISGEWPTTKLRAQVAWHHTEQHESARDPAAADIPQELDGYVPTTLPGADQAFADACLARSSSMFAACPDPGAFFRQGGAGLLTDTKADRPSATLDAAHTIGSHVLRAGVTDEDTRFTQTQRFTGGEEILSLFPGHVDIKRFLDTSQLCDPADATTPCKYLDQATVTYRTRYTAGYVEDTITLAPGLVADLGLRVERMQVSRAFTLDEPAPRLGLSWDFLGGGRSRAWASFGRTYPLIPTGIGENVVGTAPLVDDITLANATGRSITPSAAVQTSPTLEAPTQDEITLGAQVALLEQKLRVTGWVQGRWYRRGFETENFLFQNPGRTDDGAFEAIRETQMVALELATSPALGTSVRAGWTYGRTYGTWLGPLSPLEGATLYNSTEWDQDHSANMFGLLPTDLGHRVYVEFVRSFHWPRHTPGGVSLRGSVQSGHVRDAVGFSELGNVELLPRGSLGRDPMVSSVDLRLYARPRGFVVSLEVFDLFARNTPTATDPVYIGETQGVRPIVGGTYEDLIWATDSVGSSLRRNPRFETATETQVPFGVVLGIQRSF